MPTSVWKINPDDFPQSASLEEKIKFWLRYAILAPSAHNTQPWKCAIQHNSLELWRDEKHTLQAGDPTLRETFLSLGAFLENFVYAANQFGYQPTVHTFAHTIEDLKIAKIVFSAPKNKGRVNSTLLSAMLNRHTNRGYYDSNPLSSKVIDELKVSAEEEIKEFIITDRKCIDRISQLVGKGTHIALSMRAMKEELATLVTKEADNANTGMFVESMTEDAPKATSGKDWVMKHLDPKVEAHYWQKTFAAAPVLVIVGSAYDGPEAWLASGRVMERILLRGALHGLTHCISAAPIEVPTLAPLLRKEIDADYRPQVLIRLGYPLNPSFTRYSNRRSSALT